MRLEFDRGSDGNSGLVINNGAGRLVGSRGDSVWLLIIGVYGDLVIDRVGVGVLSRRGRLVSKKWHGFDVVAGESANVRNVGEIKAPSGLS